MHLRVTKIKNHVQTFIYKVAPTLSCGKPCGSAKLHSTLWYSSAYLSGAHAKLRCINITHVVPASPHRSFTWSNTHQVLSATFCMFVHFISVCLQILLFSKVFLFIWVHSNMFLWLKVYSKYFLCVHRLLKAFRFLPWLTTAGVTVVTACAAHQTLV